MYRLIPCWALLSSNDVPDITTNNVIATEVTLTRMSYNHESLFDAFNELAFKTLFEGIKVKPGKPTILGKIGNTYILNLPGNPLASALIFELFGKLIVQKLLGSNDIYHNSINAKIKSDFKNKKGRITIIPGNFDGEYFKVEKKRSPGMVSTLSSCNSIIVLDEKGTVLHTELVAEIANEPDYLAAKAVL